MDTLKMLKNGSGIHIKKSHKGLFTKYCNGKVTNECILRGKHSSDPKIRKRATFADNARHFKHKLGGLIAKALKGIVLLLDNTKIQMPIIPPEKYKIQLTTPSFIIGLPVSLGLSTERQLIRNINDLYKKINTHMENESAKHMIPYDKSKEIMLTTGNANTMKISTNMLDSLFAARDIYNNSSEGKKNPLTIEETLGLPMRETMFGLYKRHSQNKQDDGRKMGTPTTATNLISNWQQISPGIFPNSYTDKYNAIILKFNNNGGILSDEDKQYLLEHYERVKHTYESLRPLKENALVNGYRFFKTGMYGGTKGDMKHDNLVRLEGALIMTDPAIRKYLLNKKLISNDVAQVYKKGGLIKAQAGTKVLNFLNSDLGKGLLTFIGNGIGQISNSVKSANYAKNFDDATNTQVKAMKEKAYGNVYLLGLTAALYYLLPQDGVNYGDIDRQLFALKYAESTMNLEDIEKFKMDRLKEKLQLLEAIQGSSFNFGDLLQLGLGTVGLILGSKQESPDYFSNYFNNKIELPKTNFSLTSPKQELISPFKDYSKINNLKLDLLKYGK